jgi:hypothetical protein
MDPLQHGEAPPGVRESGNHQYLARNPLHGSSDLFPMYCQLQTPPSLVQAAIDPITRGPWSSSEDEQLLNAVARLGAAKWTDIAKFVPTRTSKQCRERWFNCLCPEIKHDAFQPWEDQVIIDRQRELGNRWALIARHLPGRSTNAIKNRWYSGLRSHELQGNRQSSPLGLVANHESLTFVHGQFTGPGSSSGHGDL